MANLSDRGQILLIAGFALAVTFVGLALVLNSVIFTENLATRSDSTTIEPLSHANDVERAAEALLEHVNEEVSTPSSSYTTLEDSLETGFENVTNASMRHQLAAGLAVSDTLGTVHRGTWIRQTNESRNFSDVNGAVDWDPIDSGANGARSLRIFVSDDTTLDGANPFTLVVDDGTDTWDLAIDGTEVTTSDGVTCSHSASSFWVNVSAGRVGGTDCAGLAFASDLDGIESIKFQNAVNVTGRYRILVNKSNSSIAGTEYGSSPDDPFRQRALYSAILEVDVEREALVYRADIRAEPGDTDD